MASSFSLLIIDNGAGLWGGKSILLVRVLGAEPPNPQLIV